MFGRHSEGHADATRKPAGLAQQNRNRFAQDEHAGVVPLYAVFCAFSPSFSIVCSRITNFWILPVMVIGNSGTNSM